MIFKNLLKIMLPSLLVAGSVTVFAAGDNVVKLVNDATTTWEDFATAITDPSKAAVKVKGTLADDNAALVAYNNAVTKVATDSTALETVKANNDTTALRGALNTAISDSTTYATTNKDAIANAEKAYNDSVAYIPVLEQELADSVSAKTTLLGRQQTVQGLLQIAITNVTRFETQIANLPKKIETAEWLQIIYAGAEAFRDYNDSEYKAYYRNVTYSSNKTRLLITFGEEAPKDGATWESKDTPEAFDSYITGLNPWPNQIAVNYGSEYKTANGGTGNEYQVVSVNSKNDYDALMTAITDKIETILSNAKYQTQTVDTNSSDYITAKTSLDNAQADVDQYTRELNGFHEGDEGWTSTSEEIYGIYEQIADNEQKQQDLKAEIASRKAGLEALKNESQTFQTKLEELHTAIVKAQDNLANAKSNVKAAQDAFDSSKAARVTAAAALNKAQAEADAAATLANYQTITLTGDVTATTVIAKNFSGTIKGGKYVINNGITGNTPIFDEFSGTLTNAGINGAFAEVRSGRFQNVAVVNGTALRLYDESGAMTTPANLGVLGYNAREFCGVDFTTKKLADLSDATIVHNIDVYNPAEPTVAPNNYYATQNGSKFTTYNNASLTLGKNVFAVAKNTLSTAIANVIYPDADDNMVCDNVVIEDKVAFYNPIDFKAKSLTYNREFKEGNNTVCLPFPLKKSLNENIEAVSTYDTEEVDSKGVPTFWFTVKMSGEIEANTPVLLTAKTAFTLSLTDVELAVSDTPSDQRVMVADTKTGGASFGTFKLIGRDEVLGAANAEKVYGLSGSKFQPASSTASFPAFRMVVCSATKATSASAPRRIGFRDEMGKEINIGGGTTAIEDINADATEFSVKGGVGELTITAEADYGKVEIYSLDGRVAAVANVAAGTTSVSLQHGLYIVMGKKVVVK